MDCLQLIGMRPLNATEETKVNDLVSSMLENGWQGAPVLVYGEELLTGSHRITALRKIVDMCDDGELDSLPDFFYEDIGEDVSDLVEEAFAKFEDENGYCPELDCSDLGWMFEGTWVEEYMNEIAEW